TSLNAKLECILSRQIQQHGLMEFFALYNTRYTKFYGFKRRWSGKLLYTCATIFFFPFTFSRKNRKQKHQIYSNRACRFAFHPSLDFFFFYSYVVEESSKREWKKSLSCSLKQRT